MFIEGIRTVLRISERDYRVEMWGASGSIGTMSGHGAGELGMEILISLSRSSWGSKNPQFRVARLGTRILALRSGRVGT
ncbi:UNVERIFIED_CONTAM: hypothetical protein Slati_2711900 [Sesamum latifolium]|uniref:Uncharacterized protein n=1 Tax=Sesamum latifolium TaxID=2727402 RepID=A0AAW2VXX6_9LAMI